MTGKNTENFQNEISGHPENTESGTQQGSVTESDRLHGSVTADKNHF
jgi:hypothetical protein